MSSQNRQLHLNAFLMANGHHEAAWRTRTPVRACPDPAALRGYHQNRERGKLDSIFLADGVALWETLVELPQPVRTADPAVCVGRRHRAIGLIATASTTTTSRITWHASSPRSITSAVVEPLEHRDLGGQDERSTSTATRGRITNCGTNGRPNSSRLRPGSGQLGRRGAGHRQAEWIYADTDLIHTVDHIGEHFQVRGPLNTPRPVQGYPLLVQAGSSETGKEYAARFAEAVFTAQQSFDEGKAFYDDVKSRLARYGRSPDEIKILPGISPIIGRTEAKPPNARNSSTP